MEAVPEEQQPEEQPEHQVTALTCSVEEAAAIIGIGVGATRRLIAQGKIAHFRVGRHIRVPRRAIEEFITNAMQASPAARR